MVSWPLAGTSSSSPNSSARAEAGAVDDDAFGQGGDRLPVVQLAHDYLAPRDVHVAQEGVQVDGRLDQHRPHALHVGCRERMLPRPEFGRAPEDVGGAGRTASSRPVARPTGSSCRSSARRSRRRRSPGSTGRRAGSRGRTARRTQADCRDPAGRRGDRKAIVVVEVDRVVDAGGQHGVTLQVLRLGAVGLRGRGRSRATCCPAPPWAGSAGDVHAQITMRSISSTVTVSAVRS